MDATQKRQILSGSFFSYFVAFSEYKNFKLRYMKYWQSARTNSVNYLIKSGSNEHGATFNCNWKAGKQTRDSQVDMSLSWNFPAWVKPRSYEVSEPSQAGALQFSSWNRADNIDNMLSKNCKFLLLLKNCNQISQF